MHSDHACMCLAIDLAVYVIVGRHYDMIINNYIVNSDKGTVPKHSCGI